MTDAAPTTSRHDDEIDQALRGLVDGLAHVTRSPVLHRPDEEGLVYEDVTFGSRDGVPLEGWFIPARGSAEIVVANHPMGFSRSGYPSHLEPYRSLWASSGNTVEVNFVPDYRILHDAGYNVLCYDMRNFGHSGAANGGVLSSGIFESRDVLGSLDYVRSRVDTRDMAVGLFSRCLGCDATLYAMTVDPDAFADVRCLLACNPVTEKVINERMLGLNGIPADRIDDMERLLVLATGLGYADRDTQDWARSVRVPTFFYGVHDDVLTTPDDLQAMYDNVPIEDKRLHWIHGSTRRWDGYLEFQRRPDPMLDWLASHLRRPDDPRSASR